jgi:hypothetical protein
MKHSNIKSEDISIRNIFANNNIVLSENGEIQPIHEPIWRDKYNDKLQTAAFDISKQIPAELTVELSTISKEYKNSILEGVINGKVLFSGHVNGSETVQVECQINPGTFAYSENESIEWQLNDSVTSPKKVGSSQFDLFWIDLGHVPESLLRKGTSVELLKVQKSCNDKLELFDFAPNPLVNNVPAIVQSVFNNTPPRYDIWRGANYFTTINGWNNITLHYNAYLNAHNNLPNSILNCYDAAAVLQHYLQYNRYASSYCFMSPFGYLRQSNLIGRGQCNNPFYGGSGGPAIINRQYNTRTAFGNHAFLHLTSNSAIVDACAGPHTGTEYAAAYVANATDDVYPNPPSVQRGTTANIGYYTGVTHVNLIKSIYAMFKTPHDKALKKLISFKSNAVHNDSGKIIAGTWMNPLGYSDLSSKWTSIYEEIVPGEEEVLKMIMLKNGDKMIMFKLYVSSAGNNLALNRFLSIASLSQNSELPFENIEDTSGHYSVANSNKGSNHFVGVYHNAVLSIQSTDDDIDLNGLAEWYFNWSKNHLTSQTSEVLPNVALNSGQTKDGLLNVSAKNNESIRIEYIDTHEKARLISAKKGELILDSIAKETKKLRFATVDSNTLLVKTIDLVLKDVKKI